MSCRYSLIYCGLDACTLEVLLKSSQFTVIAVADIDQFTHAPTKNWVDKLFQYTWRFKKKNSVFTVLCLRIYLLISAWSSYSFKQSAKLLKLMCSKGVQVIQVDNLSAMEYCCKKYAVDILVVNNWSLLPESILELPKYGTMNIHPSKLPEYRGSLPTLWSLKNKDKASALSFIRLAAGMDNGNIIAQLPFDILGTDDAITLEHKIESLIEQNMESVLHQYITDGHTIQQDEDKATFTEKYHPYMKIDWHREKAIDIVNKINLYPYLCPFDFCYSEEEGHKIFYEKAGMLVELPENIALSEMGKPLYFQNMGYIRTVDGYVTVQVN